jgi:hypothetical protein
MGKAGLIASTILVAGFAVGLGFSAQHIVLNRNAKYEYKAQIESPEIRTISNYNDAASQLGNAAFYLGEIITKDNQVLIVEAPNIATSLEYLGNAAQDLLVNDESKKYAVQIMDISKEVIRLNEPEKEAEKYQSLEKKITDLKDDIIFFSSNLAPKMNEIKAIETLYYSKANRQTGSSWGAVGASIGVVACGIWAGFQGYEVSEDLSYERRNNKRTRNKV